MRASGLYRRGHVWYWRTQLQILRRISCLGSPKLRTFDRVDVSVSLFARDRNGNIELAARLSSVVLGWFGQAKMLGVLEKMQAEEVRALVRWALADLRDFYCARIPMPSTTDPQLVNALAKKLKAEAVALQAATESGDFEFAEGPARNLLRRRGVAADTESPQFQEFLRIVMPTLIQARISELGRLGATKTITVDSQANSAPVPQPAVVPDEPSSTEGVIQTGRQLTVPGIGSAVISSRFYRMEDALEDMLRTARRENRLSRKTQVQYRQSAELLVKILGDRPLPEITREMASALRETVLSLPAKYGQSARYQNMSIEQIVAEADRHPDTKRLTPQTWNRHHVALYSIFVEAKLRGKVEKNVFEGLRYRRPNAARDGVAPHEVRPGLGEKNLQILFGSPIFTGMRSDQFRHQPGKIVRHDAKFWLLVLMLGLGLRPEEAAQLKISDFSTEHDVQMLRVTSEGGRSVKTVSANRWMPISRQLKEIGLMDFVEDRRLTQEEFLFRECRPSGRFGKRSIVVGKALNRYIRRIGIRDRDLPIYSLRHDFASTLKKYRIDPQIVSRLMGHATGHLAFDQYTSEIMHVLHDALDTAQFPALKLVKAYRSKNQSKALQARASADPQPENADG